MARHRRFVLPGHPQHVIQRGNNKSVIFADDADYRFYLDKLTEASVRFDCRVHAYVLMTNHVHLLMTPGSEKSISYTMQSLGRYYVQRFNYRYRRTGTLWEGRYKATLLDTEQYLLTCYRYIELNPVRAGLVKRAADYRWSSFQCNGRGENDPLVIPHQLYMQLGATRETRQSTYRKLFRLHISDQDLDAIRHATNRAWVLGNDRFKCEIEELLNRQASPHERGGDRKSRSFQEKQRINRV